MDNIFNKKLPYLTKNIPGIGGKIKQYNEDFIVTEIPLYECTHDGEHIFLEIEKNIATFDIIQKIASQLTISKKTIGYAGIKDKNAITRQYVSVPYSQKDNIKNINIQGLSILSTQRHKNKLHIGHLKGNAFKILIRECTPLLDNVNKILSILSQRGVPNYFGQQRFGYNNSTGVLGKYLLQEEYEKFIETIFMRSSKDTPLIEETKLLIHNKQYGEALKIIPRGFAVEKNILKHLSKGKSFEYAINRIDKKMKNFYICAYQSNLFNSLLADRIEKIDTIYYGDIAIKHPGRAAFKVEDEEAEKKRCSQFEISPSGPIFGYKMLNAFGETGKKEQQLLQEENLDTNLFRNYKMKGERRAYRFSVGDVATEKSDEGIWVSFSLPKGCYATVVLREIMKTD